MLKIKNVLDFLKVVYHFVNTMLVVKSVRVVNKVII